VLPLEGLTGLLLKTFEIPGKASRINIFTLSATASGLSNAGLTSRYIPAVFVAFSSE
jgi:hypothetical protein